ncbi:MAG: type II secretion system F family protein [Candidatus Sumerlaeota bacterium]|nr:type II secretion system F family protein [Candidatus Sumerlaeota bacterium]
MKPDDVQRLIGDLASFTKMGVPVPDGLREVAQTLGDPRARRLYEELAASIARGASLSQALAKITPPLPAELIAAAQCGEASGDMGGVLRFILDQSRRIKRHHTAMVSALFYPAIAVIISLCVMIVLAVFVIPPFRRIFDELGADSLPLPTTLLFAVMGSRAFIPAMVALLIALVAGLARIARRDSAPVILKALDIFVPLVSLSDGAIVMRFLGSMLQRGVPLPTALRAASLAVWLARTRRMLLVIAGEAERGFATGPLMRKVLPPAAAYLYAQAEARGDSPQACEGIAEYCEEHFDMISERLTGMLEPAIIFFLGGVVGGIVTSLYLPLFELGQYIR